MIKVMTMALALAAAPLFAHEEAGMKDVTGTANSGMMMKKHGKKMKHAKKAAAKEHWVCPMHDGGESDHAGKCPKCGMDLVLEKAVKK